MEDEILTEEDLLVKHRREKKDLQAQVQKLKHAVPKGDKKRKKEATDEIARMEDELKMKHEEELVKLAGALDERELPVEVEEVGKGVAKLTTEGNHDGPTEEVRKISKAQKRRDKKAAEEKEREKRIKEQEVENLTGDRHLESEKLRSILEELNLCVHEIPSDGNCLYNAICHQLALKNMQTSNYTTLRTQTANYMLSHEEDVLPFMTTKNSDSLCSSEEYKKICNDIATTPAWGGQIEIMALSHVLKVPIKVIQAEGEPVVVGQEYDKDIIILTYHRHAFGLGEHYNSVKPMSEAEDPNNPHDGF